MSKVADDFVSMRNIDFVSEEQFEDQEKAKAQLMSSMSERDKKVDGMQSVVNELARFHGILGTTSDEF